MSGLGTHIYVIKPTNDQSKLNSPEKAEKPTDSKPQPADWQTEAFLPKAISSKDFKRTSPPGVLPTTFFGKMKSFLSSTI